MCELEELFRKYKGAKTAVYGLGVEAEKALKKLDGYLDVIGLLDGFRENGCIYGKPIISLSETVQERVVLIIVAARPSSCRAIARRIRDICVQNRIALIDIRGRDLLLTDSVSYDFCHIHGIAKKELMERIDNAEVVSFDLFDTLIMRQTLLPEDVYEYVENGLHEKGVHIVGFSKKRLESEKTLSRYSAPSLVDIYGYLLAGEETKITAEEAAQLEWRIDYKLIIPRRQVCGLLEYAYEKGKDVYVVSDSYYGKKEVSGFLTKCGIVKWKDIFVSSEHKKSKTQGLFRLLRDKIGEKEWLHIGDDIIADIECAENEKIKTCRLYSGIDLFEASGYMGMEDYMDTLAARLKIGMFVSCIFNSPFQFESIDKKICVTDAAAVGYLFCAPLITDFVFWFRENVRKHNIKNIWFSSRDGYLIRKLYHEIEPDRRSIYFLTSRTAAIRAGVKNEADIRYVDGMKFSGSVEENVKERFGLAAKEDETRRGTDEAGLMRYQDSILKRAKEARTNYRKYIGKLHMEKGDIAFFDFVAKGTVQMYVQRLTDHHMKGLYFLQLEAEQMKEWDLDIQSYYTEKEGGAFFDSYYILETLLTAPFPSLRQFDAAGQPVYAEEKREQRNIRCFERMQRGVWEYFRTYTTLCPAEQIEEHKKLNEIFLSLIHKIKLTDEAFLDMVIEDSFFNRMTKVAEVL